MKARTLVVTEPGRIELSEVDVPDVSDNPHMVVVETQVSLISPGTEIACFLDEQDFRPYRYPRGLGYSSMGKIIAKGKAVLHLEVGDLVLNQMEHGSHVWFDTRTVPHTKAPAGTDVETGVFARIIVIGMTTLCLCKAKPGDFVAVFGLGLVGNLTAQLFKASGMNVVGFELSERRKELARQCGIEALDVPITEPEKIKQEYTAGGEGFHLLIDAAGKPEAFIEATKVARKGAEIFLVGFNWTKQSEISAAHVLQVVFRNFLTVKSGWEFQLPHFSQNAEQWQDFTPGSTDQNMRHALKLITGGKIEVEKLITHRVKPEQAQEIYDGLHRDSDKYFGVLFDWRDG